MCFFTDSVNLRLEGDSGTPRPRVMHYKRYVKHCTCTAGAELDSQYSGGGASSYSKSVGKSDKNFENATETRRADIFCEPKLISGPDQKLQGAGFGPWALSLTHVL